MPTSLRGWSAELVKSLAEVKGDDNDVLIISKLVILLKIDIIAATGEPVGRKANWSVKERLGGGVRKAGYRKHRTTVCSMMQVRTCVMEMGL